MKNAIRPTILLAGYLLIHSTALRAQDPVVVAANVYKKVLVDNDVVRVIELEFAPGDVAPWHHHPNHVAYALTAGKLEITDKDKAPIVADLKAGDALYLPAVTHMAKNIGTTTVKMVVTEMKPPAHAESK